MMCLMICLVREDDCESHRRCWEWIFLMQLAKEAETVAIWKGECWEKVEFKEEMWQANAPERADIRHVLRPKSETLLSRARGCALVGRGALRTDTDAPSTVAEKLGS